MVNPLVDTHVAMWMVSEPERLPPRVRQLLQDEANTIYLSTISIWEKAIKFALRRASSPPFDGRQLLNLAKASGCRILAVTEAHAVAVDDLPLLHADPFDRLILAQSITEPMRLISHDRRLVAYSDAVIAW